MKYLVNTAISFFVLFAFVLGCLSREALSDRLVLLWDEPFSYLFVWTCLACCKVVVVGLAIVVTISISTFCVCLLVATIQELYYQFFVRKILSLRLGKVIGVFKPTRPREKSAREQAAERDSKASDARE